MEALCQLSYSPEEPTIYQRPSGTRLGRSGFEGTSGQPTPR